MALGLVVTRVWAAWVVLHLAGCASETLRAFTHESIQQSMAATAVPARAASTAVPLNLAVSTHETRLANTLVASGHLLAGPSILTLSMAAVHIYLAGFARPLWRTEAFEAVLHVDAGPTLTTGAGGTFICVFSTGRP